MRLVVSEPDCAPNIKRLSVGSFEPAALDHAISGGSLDHVQLGRGAFGGELLHANLSADRRLDYGAYNLPLLACGEMPGNHLVLGLVGSEAGSGTLNGAVVRQGSLVVIPERGELHYQTAPKSRWCGLQVARCTLTQAGVEPLAATTQSANLDPAHRHRLWCVVTSAIGTLAAIERHDADILDETLAVRAVTESLTEAFISALAAACPGDTPRRALPTRHFMLARRARDCITADLSAPTRISELCLQVGTSFKTLERAFVQAYGVRPKEFLTLTRLARARRLLWAASPGETTVATVAMDCGYYHLGRFSRDYAAMFAEQPSVTLRSPPRSVGTPPQ